jgi:hypothetical protein
MGRKSLGIRICTCKICGRLYEYDRSKRSNNTATKCSKCTVQKWRKTKKIKAIEYKGGKCEMCGYNKCVAALEFHHLDPNTKEFEIGNNTFSWNRNKQELDKCILVCANCHREIEHCNAGFI